MSKARDIARAGTALANVDATELGYLDGVTSSVQTQLNGKQAIVSGVNDTEIGYLDGVTSAIQTQLDAKIANALVDAKGDILTATADNTPARLAVGSNNTVLTADSTTATGLKWGSVNVTKSYSLLGSATLTGASTITISGISGIDDLFVYIFDASSASASSNIRLRLNSDSGTNYNWAGQQLYAGSTYSSSIIDRDSTSSNQDSFRVGSMSTNASSIVDGYARIFGCNSSGIKIIQATSASNQSGGASALAWSVGGYWNNSSTVTSVSLISQTGNFDGGTLYVYGAA